MYTKKQADFIAMLDTPSSPSIHSRITSMVIPLVLCIMAWSSFQGNEWSTRLIVPPSIVMMLVLSVIMACALYISINATNFVNKSPGTLMGQVHLELSANGRKLRDATDKMAMMFLKNLTITAKISWGLWFVYLGLALVNDWVWTTLVTSTFMTTAFLLRYYVTKVYWPARLVEVEAE